MKRLTYLANKCGTDKGTVFGPQHGFTEIYDDYFQKIADNCYSNNRKVNILEIGVLDGESLQTYNRFFDKNCEIYGIDIDDCTKHSSSNIHIDICDQGNRSELEDFLKRNNNIKFDIIIDDGCHRSKEQLITLSSLHKSLSKNGIYIIEDLHTSLDEEYGHTKTENNTLYYLTFGKPSIFLTEEENNELKENIKNVIIFYNKNKMNSSFSNKSITSIITFEN